MISYIAVVVVARYDGRDRDTIINAVEEALGCDGDEDECPMITCSSTVVNDLDAAFAFIGAEDED